MFLSFLKLEEWMRVYDNKESYQGDKGLSFTLGLILIDFFGHFPYKI
jgi:hypothetical protein